VCYNESKLDNKKQKFAKANERKEKRIAKKQKSLANKNKQGKYMSRNQNILTKGDKANGSTPLSFEFFQEEGISTGEKRLSDKTKAKIGRLMSNVAFRSMQL